jgi:hypothetical protein
MKIIKGEPTARVDYKGTAPYPNLGISNIDASTQLIFQTLMGVITRHNRGSNLGILAVNIFPIL